MQKELDYEFTLQDREAKIQSTNDLHNLEKYGYVSFSGGYDSCVTSELLDYSLPGNKIPRVYFNTGIEYKEMVDFVKELAKNDDRFIIINSGVNIKKMLEENGYPFKSKQHSHNWSMYVNNGEEVNKIIQELKDNPKKQFDYDFIHNLDRGTKTIIKYVFGLREKTTKKNKENKVIYSYLDCPEKLLYQFTNKFKESGLKFSEKCCYRLKKDIARAYEEQSGRTIAITGMRAEEGGMRAQNGCTIFSEDGKLKKFHPLKVVSDEWEKEFVKRNNVKICKLYYPPYNFKRTGCVACPYALNIQEELNRLYKYLPNEYKKALMIWKPVYDEYIRIGYRLKYYPHERGIQLSLEDFLEEENKGE